RYCRCSTRFDAVALPDPHVNSQTGLIHQSGTEMASISRAALWMAGAIGSFTAMAVAGREVSFALDTFEIMLFRSLVGVLIMLTVITAGGKWGQITTSALPLHMLRNAAHFTGQNLWFFALTVIPLAQ